MKDKILTILGEVKRGITPQWVAANQILSLLGENETDLSDADTKHDPLHDVGESHAERVEKENASVGGALGKITDTENNCSHLWRYYRSTLNGRIRVCAECHKWEQL